MIIQVNTYHPLYLLNDLLAMLLLTLGVNTATSRNRKTRRIHWDDDFAKNCVNFLSTLCPYSLCLILSTTIFLITPRTPGFPSQASKEGLRNLQKQQSSFTNLCCVLWPLRVSMKIQKSSIGHVSDFLSPHYRFDYNFFQFIEISIWKSYRQWYRLKEIDDTHNPLEDDWSPKNGRTYAIMRASIRSRRAAISATDLREANSALKSSWMTPKSCAIFFRRTFVRTAEMNLSPCDILLAGRKPKAETAEALCTTYHCFLWGYQIE